MNARGQYGKETYRSSHGEVAIGFSFEEIKQLDAGWNALYQSLASQVGELTPDPRSSSGYHYTTQPEYDRLNPDPQKVAWWKALALPWIKRWVSFKREQFEDRTIGDAFVQPNWHSWQALLVELRAEAQRRGFVIGAAPMVGITLFHTVGDRDRAVEQMNTEFNTLMNELYREMGVADLEALDPTKMSDPKYVADFKRKADAAVAKMQASPLYALYHDVVSPFRDEWKAFYHDQSSWEEFKTSWETYENWDKRHKALRARVEDEIKHRGGQVLAPVPGDLPETVWQEAGGAASKGAGAIARGAGDVLSVVKYGVIAVIGIGAVVAVSSVVSNMKKGRDPVEHYVGLYRGRRAAA